MNRIIWIVLLFSLYSFGQNLEENEVYSPFNPKSTTNTYCIKAKTLPYLIGNGLGINNSLGVEIGFLKNNSIGVDGFYNYSQDSRDYVTDKAGIKHDSGDRSYLKEKAIQFSYRYYFNFQKLRNVKRKAFYSGLFYRIENDLSLNDENFKNDYIRETTDSKAYGLLIGMISKFKNYKHFGMDYSVSIGSQNKTVSGLNEAYETTFRKSKANYFNIGISLNYWF
jgi:hypothetical protein